MRKFFPDDLIMHRIPRADVRRLQAAEAFAAMEFIIHGEDVGEGLKQRLNKNMGNLSEHAWPDCGMLPVEWFVKP
ncbi:hypothetical protein P4S72_13100 [Vibrio sp. PP-XX7]